jgi:hypothetical protein
MNKKLNKLVTNYPVDLTEEEIENLSATLAPVVAACGGGGGGTGGKIYTGTGYVNVNNTTNQIGLTEDANDKLNKEYVEYNEYSTAIANRYTKTQTNALLDEKQDELVFEGYDDKIETINGSGFIVNGYVSTATYLMDKNNFNKKINYLSASVSGKEDKLTFEYDEDNKVSAINGSALAGQGGTTYTPGQYIDITNNEISVTGVVAADEYATYSGDWNDVSNSYKTNSGSFLTSEDLTQYSTIEHANDASANAFNQATALIPDVSDFITKDVDNLTNYYKKTQTSSDGELAEAFGSILKYNVTAAAGIEVTTATDAGIKTYGISMTAQPVVTDTRLSGYNGIAAEPDGNVSGLWDVGLTQDMLNTINGKLDSTEAAQTYLEKATYASDSATFLTKTSADNDYAPKTITATVNTLTGASAKWENASNVVATNSANWNAKVDQSDLDNYLTKAQYGTDSATFALKNQLDEYATLEQLENASGKLLTTAQYQTDSATYALKTQLDDYYKKTDTSSKDELSTEFAKYVTTSLLDTVSSTLNDDIEYVSGQVDNKVDEPTEGNKIFVYQTTGTTTSGWEEIPIELDKSGRNFAIGVENEFVERGSTTDILLQGYQNSGTYVDFAQGYQNSAFQYGISQGYQNIANYESMAQGYINTAINIALAQGSTNSANYQAFAQGILNKANYDSLAQGHSNSAVDQSIAQGLENTAYHYSFAQGYNNKADMQSFAQGADNRASYYSQTIGHNLIASGFTEDGYDYGLFAIGGYNATTSNALFVVGNGSSYNGVPTRSDAFVIYKDGHVSAKGDIYANGVKLGPGGGTSYQGRNGVNVDGGYIELTQTAYNAVTSVSSKLDTTAAAQTYLTKSSADNDYAPISITSTVNTLTAASAGWNNKVDKPTSIVDKYLVLRTDNAGNVSGWCDFQDQSYSKSEANGTFVATANIDTTTLSGDGKSVSTKLGVKTDVIATKDWLDDNYLPLSGGTVSGNVIVKSTGSNLLAVNTTATLMGQSRVNSLTDTTAIGTNWLGVNSNGGGFLKNVQGGNVGDLNGTSIQINFAPNGNTAYGNITVNSQGNESKVVHVPTASYNSMSSFDNTNGPNYMLRKTASGFDIGAAVINVTSLPATTEANTYYFVYDV